MDREEMKQVINEAQPMLNKLRDARRKGVEAIVNDLGNPNHKKFTKEELLKPLKDAVQQIQQEPPMTPSDESLEVQSAQFLSKYLSSTDYNDRDAARIRLLSHFGSADLLAELKRRAEPANEVINWPNYAGINSDLLAACKAILPFVVQYCDDKGDGYGDSWKSDELKEAIAQLKAAIAKAKS